MFYIFDLDGTLISSYLENPDKDFNTWHVLPNRAAKLAELLEAGHTVALASNQGGVAFGLVTEDEVRAKFAAVKQALGLPDGLNAAVAFGHPDGQPPYNNAEFVSYRKPNPRMIFDLMLVTGHKPPTTIFIGDRPEDEAAARAARVTFQWAHEFFDA